MSAVVRTVADLRTRIAEWQSQTDKIALVPTMGALHEGHLSLVKQAAKECDRVVVSIFVNPKQFATGEDLDTYPRNENSDLAALTPLGVSLVYAPATDSVYGDGFETRVEVGGLTECMCGFSRPHFFGGVATVVTKLLIQCAPDRAYFGEKDYQQLLVVRRLTEDLDIPSEIVGCPIIREADGLALSSRNAYLSAQERQIAPALFETLRKGASRAGGGENCRTVERWAVDELRTKGFDGVDYVDIRDAANLASLDRVADTTGTKAGARIFAAATLGATRLIDNLAIETDS